MHPDGEHVGDLHCGGARHDGNADECSGTDVREQTLDGSVCIRCRVGGHLAKLSDVVLGLENKKRKRQKDQKKSENRENRENRKNEKKKIRARPGNGKERGEELDKNCATYTHTTTKKGPLRN